MEPQTNLAVLPENEPPPVFSAWSHLYIAVIVYWAILLSTLYALSREWTY